MMQDEIEKTLDDIPVPLEVLLAEMPLEDYLKVIMLSSQARFKSMKGKTSRATYLHKITVTCGQYLRLLRG